MKQIEEVFKPIAPSQLPPFNEMSLEQRQHTEKMALSVLGGAMEQFVEGDKLIPFKAAIVGGVPTRVCDARELHQALGSQRWFSDWINEMIKRERLVEGMDYLTHKIVSQVPHQGGFRGVTTTEYTLSESAADVIAMRSNTPKGDEIRKYISKCKQLTFRMVGYHMENSTLYALTGPAAQRNKYLADQDAEKAAKKQVAEDYKQFLKDFVGPPTREQAELPFSLLKLENAELTVNLEKCHTYMRHVGKCIRDINKGNGQMPKPVYKIPDFYENFETYVEKL